MKSSVILLFLLFILSPYSYSFNDDSANSTFWQRLMKEQSYINLQKGILYMQNNRYREASIEFSKAIDKNPDSFAYTMYGASLYWLGEIKGSIEQYDQALKLDEKNSTAWQLRGISEARMGDINSAMDNFLKSLKLDYKRGDINMNIASVYFSLGKVDDSIFYIKQALKYEPSNPLYHYQFGLINFYLERYEEAADNFKKAISIYSNYEEAVLWLALSMEKIGNNEEALKMYMKAISIKPMDFFARYRAAKILLSKGKRADALKQIRESFYLNPNNSEGGVSLFLSYGNSKNESEEKNVSFKNSSISEIYKNLSKTSQDEEINFSLDIAIAQKPNLEEASEGKLKSALKKAALNRKYISRDYVIPAGSKEEREKLIEKYLKEIDSEIMNDSNYDYRVNFSMNTKKVKNKEESPSAVYLPRNIGNEMGLWIYGNSWINIIEDDIENIPQKDDELYDLLYALAYILYGDGEKSALLFNKAINKYPVESRLGLAISYVCIGKEDRSAAYLKEVLNIDPKNKIASQNLKWIYGK